MTPRWWLVAALALVTGRADAQGVADRVAAVETGVLRLTYPIREGVEICDRGTRFSGRRSADAVRERYDLDTRCRRGTAEAELAVRDGVVRDLEVLEADDVGTPGSVDLGSVEAAEAARWFLTLARGFDGQPPVDDAVFAAAIADVPELWRDLMALARDQRLGEDVRGEALFWLGQDAAAAVSEGIAAVASDEREDQEVREAAVFALSQRPPAEGVPFLMEIARSADQGETRENAMFWLAQSGDARVLAFFEEILLGTPPR